ncbi:MAG: CHAP domain-containing protein, partial [Actinomycetia bacterium]|nr:CHAP domain-containing protein [Actinomycetes bacterium]
MASPDICATNGPNHDGVDSTNPAVQAGSGWQCVELAARLYFVRGWGAVGTVGNGGAAYIPEGSPSLKSYRNGSGYIPVPGDLIIEKATAKNRYGHVSIVDSVVGSTINVVEQNASVSGREAYTLTGSSIAGGYSAVWGVVHSPKNSGDFQVSVAPSTSKVAAGQSAQFSVGSTILAGTAQPLKLLVTGLPPGANAAFSTNPIQTGSAATLTVTTSTTNPAGGTPGGVYELSLKGVAGGEVRTAGFTLQVKNPNTPVLNSAQYTDGGVNLFFAPPAMATGNTIRYYRYQLSFDGGASINYDNIAQDVDSPFVAGGCQVGQVCTYRIAAVVDTGTSAWSNWKKVTPIATPVLNSAKYTDGGVNLFFTAPAMATGNTIRYYRYQLSFDGGASINYDNIAQDVDSPFVAGGC